MKTALKVLALFLAVVMMVPFFAACNKGEGDTSSVTDVSGTTSQDATDLDAVSNKTAPTPTIPEYAGGDTLAVGYDLFSQKFSPFFATTQYDQDAASITQVGLLTSDREGNIILNGIEGETIAYNGTDYKYTGIADCEIVENEDGSLVYNFTLREDIFFSDGVNLTADDVIFSMYVLCDPSYDGSSTLYAVPIKGVEEYRSGMELLSNLIVADYAAGTTDNKDFYTEDQYNTYTAALEAAMKAFAQEIVDYCVVNFSSYLPSVGNNNVALGMFAWGFGSPNDDGTFTDALGTTYDMTETFPTIEDYVKNLLESYEYDLAEMSKTESAGTSLFDLIEAEIGDTYSTYVAGVVTGESADYISGIEKTGMYSLKVTVTEFSANTIYQLGLSVSPLHYYGSRDAYKYTENKFGFTKGDLSTIKSKTTKPLGAGPYKFVEYSDGRIVYERNEYYFKGCPKIKNLIFRETSDANKVSGVLSGSFDITDPSFSETAVTAVKGANSNGELIGDVITTNTVDNLGYGYIGICADTMLVGDDKASEESKNLRKAFATLFSIYRESVINSYYGDRASVIQYPISNTSWAAPKPADEGYKLAYSTDVDGNAIYTEGMTEEEQYAAALEAAVGFFKAAGFTYDEAAGKFTAAPEGARLNYEFIIPADGIGDHPAYNVVTNASAALATVGITLEINDPKDSNILWDALDAGTCDMWAAAWGATVDPDMYQVYHSDNKTGSNHYRIADAELDELIMAARSSADQAFRKATYKECLELIMDWGVEVPTYQRQNAIIMASAKINIDTVTPDITTFWGWMNDIELLEMK